MAIVPTSYWRDWWEDFDRPFRLLDRHFEEVHRVDFYKTLSPPVLKDYFRPWRSLIDNIKSDYGHVESDSDKFRVILDLHDYSPNEIIVKTIDNSIIVEAKHEEVNHKNDFLSRKFMRRYDLPRGYNIARVMSNLSRDGILTVTAPKFGKLLSNETIIPINRTSYPAIKY